MFRITKMSSDALSLHSYTSIYDERYREMRPILYIEIIFVFKTAGKNAIQEKCDESNFIMV